MELDSVSIALAWVAGILSILSPCVWPIVPIVMNSASRSGKVRGPTALACGLSLSFATAGTFLTFILLNLGFSPDAFRWVGAAVMLIVGFVLVVPFLSAWLSFQWSKFSSKLSFKTNSGSDYNHNHEEEHTEGFFGQFGVGILLGLVWLPCVGPTLGAAIALASVGESMMLAFITMASFGFGTVCALALAALASQKILMAWRPALLKNSVRGKRLLGWLLLILGLLVITGIDKILESIALRYLPTWAITL